MLSAVNHFIKQTTRTLMPGVLFLCCIAACKNDPKDIQALTTKNDMRLDVAHDVTIIYSEHGKTKARLTAKEFIRNEQAKPPYVDMKNGVNAEFYNDSLVVTSTLSAKNARYYDKEGNILVRDSVMVKNAKGEQLKTEELVWNEKIKKFYTEKFVTITTPTQILYGDGLEANEDFTIYHIMNLKGSMQVQKSEMPQ